MKLQQYSIFQISSRTILNLAQKTKDGWRFYFDTNDETNQSAITKTIQDDCAMFRQLLPLTDVPGEPALPDEEKLQSFLVYLDFTGVFDRRPVGQVKELQELAELLFRPEGIESLLVGGDRVEIIIINDGSKDRTGDIADSYAKEYPSIVKAVHQENGGHGEGINQGLRHATGKYFKTVDSDDWLSPDFPRFLDTLEAVDRQGGVDLFETNYYYEHADGKGNRSINFSNALPENRVFTWDETKPFRVDQILMIHACTFRTALLRETGLEMPKHTFYEDNYMIYGNLMSAERMYYMNNNLYRYFIGRGGRRGASAQ